MTRITYLLYACDPYLSSFLYGFYHEIHDFLFDDDGFDHLHASHCGLHLAVSQGLLLDGLFVGIGGDGDDRAHLAVDLDSDVDLGILALFFVISGPGLVSDVSS